MRLRALLLAGLASLAAAAPAQADTWNVNGTGDGGACVVATHLCPSLRAALAASDATKDIKDVINVPAGTINISNDLVVQSEVAIIGASARTTIIDGGVKYRGFRITSGGSDVDIRHFTVRRGAAGQGDSTEGGGILNVGGVVELDHVRVTESSATSGGGIANVRGTLVMTAGLVDGNTATSDSGGIANIGGGEIRGLLGVVDSTIFDNTAGTAGTGGINSRGYTGNIVILNRATVADNVGGVRGVGGLEATTGAFQVNASIVARNLSEGATSNCGAVMPTDGGFNVENDRECGFTLGGVNPGLGTSLANAGGELDVLALTAASPAVDRVPTTASICSATVPDQRGMARPQGPGCDSGAYELDPDPTVTIGSGPSGPIATRDVQFRYSTTEPGLTLQCQLTGPGRTPGFVACDKPDLQAYNGLADGNFTFSVRATPSTVPNPPVSARAFTVDTTPPQTTINSGPNGPTNIAAPTFSFSSNEAGTFECSLDGATFASCTSPVTTPTLGHGGHTFDVRAIDSVNNIDPTPARRSFTVDAVAPDTTIQTGPTGSTAQNAPSFTFTSPDGSATFECRLVGPSPSAAAPCTSPKGYGPLADGAYSFSVRAIDTLGNVDPTPATRSFTIDATPPPAEVISGPEGTTADTAPAFGFSSSDATTTFTCRLDGPAGVIEDGPCVSPKSFANLAPGAYTFTVRAQDAVGNVTTRSRSFTVTQPQSLPMPVPPTSSTAHTPGPGPIFHQTVVVQPAGGTVLVRLKGTAKFVKLDVTKDIPLGSEVDTRKGRVRLTSVPKAGAPVESAIFYDGLFIVTQPGDTTELTLSEKLASCPKAKAKKAGAAAKKAKTRKLWGDGKGKFRTKGKYSAATVRGTKWLVQDTCAGTLTRVAQGVVEVNDFVLKKKKLIRQGKSYTARPKKR